MQYLNENAIKKLAQNTAGYLLPAVGAGIGYLGTGETVSDFAPNISSGEMGALLGVGTLGGAYIGRKAATAVGGERANVYGEIPYKGIIGAGAGMVAGGVIGDAMYPDEDLYHNIGETMATFSGRNIGAAIGGAVGLSNMAEKVLNQNKQKTK